MIANELAGLQQEHGDMVPHMSDSDGCYSDSLLHTIGETQKELGIARRQLEDCIQSRWIRNIVSKQKGKA